MSPLDALDIYLCGLEPTLRIHLLCSQHVGTLELALEESRIFANAHWGHVAQASGRVELFYDHMYLTFQAPLAQHAESARPPMRSPSSSVRCFNCGQTRNMRSACRALRRSPSTMPTVVVSDSACHARRAPMRMLLELGERFPSVFYAAIRTTSRGSVLPVRRIVGTLPLDESRLCSSSP